MKYIKGYGKRYAVTIDGRVWSYPQRWKIGGGYGGVYAVRKGKWLTPTLNSQGYPMVCLTKNRKHRTPTVHRLVAETFIPNPKKLAQVNHRNKNRTDNRVENLEWISYRDNMRHAFGVDKCPKCGHKIL